MEDPGQRSGDVLLVSIFVRSLLFLVDGAPAEWIFSHAAGHGLGDAPAKVLLLGSLENNAPLTQHLTCYRSTHDR